MKPKMELLIKICVKKTFMPAALLKRDSNTGIFQ